ncbi:MAG TPA: hypothetical protein PLT09_14890 [Deltaproteobacteria bacterium]|nr:hypothetical protein [Deltaproteobacteria bacterium]HPR55026.1 hypothetical protein [Deltaproteobacteria bacterium]HXK48729.1 hypothetical protein [Deltaproteobacteria bacterium]
MGASQDQPQSGPDLSKNALFRRFFIVLSLFVVPGAIPIVAYSKARQKGMTRTMTLCITIVFLILMFVVAGLTWAH